MDYKIVLVKCGNAFGTAFEESGEKLAVMVREHISLGWEPLGGIAVGESKALKTPHLFQAMIKRR